MELPSNLHPTESLAFQNIELLAHHLFKCQGGEEDECLDYWIEAERQLNENLFCDPVPV
jgi:Protein of unknown function (DUF2934)